MFTARGRPAFGAAPDAAPAHRRNIIRFGCKKGDQDASKNSNGSPKDGDDLARAPELDWGNSIPSYLQSTADSQICDEWTDAIQEAEAVAAARKKAIEQGQDPLLAENESRAAVRLSRSVTIWNRIRQEAARDIETEPMLSSFLFTSILSHESFGEALAFVLSNRIADETLLPTQLFSLFMTLERQHPEVLRSALADLQAVYDRDPACLSYSQALLYFKGYHAIQLHRFANALWESGRHVMALLLQSRLSEVLAVDIHPAAKFGFGVLLDHGTGVVVGETAVVGDGVSIMQNVTLGGTGKEVGDRHPKIANNVLVGAGASILGNINVGIGAQVAAGSLVLKPVDPHTMVAGSPAKQVGAVIGNPAASLNQWSEECPLSDCEGLDDMPPATRPVSVPTRSGGTVHVYSEGDYYRHVDAEKMIFSGDDLRAGESAVPPEWPGATHPWDNASVAGNAARDRLANGSRSSPAGRGTSGGSGNGARQGGQNGAASPGALPAQSDIGSHLKPFQQGGSKPRKGSEKEEAERVAGTTSDEVAEELWGRKAGSEPEFFI